MNTQPKTIEEISKTFTQGNTGTGAEITIFDTELKPEEGAMVQALNSRSSGGFFKNLTKVLKNGFEDFMTRIYTKGTAIKVLLT